MVFTMFLRAHRSGIDVHVRIDFDGGDVQTGHFEQETGGGRCKWLIRDENCVSGLVRRVPMTPLPMPLTTPPETRMYFIFTIETRSDRQQQEQAAIWEEANRNFQPQYKV